MIYLDNIAASFTEDEVLDVFCNTTRKYYANPNSSHKLGLAENELIEKATENIAKLLSISKEEIIYTSGGTEANNLAIKGLSLSYKNYGKQPNCNVYNFWILNKSWRTNNFTSCIASQFSHCMVYANQNDWDNSRNVRF